MRLEKGVGLLPWRALGVVSLDGLGPVMPWRNESDGLEGDCVDGE